MGHIDSPRLIEVRAERPVAGGAMLAHDAGCVVLVTGAIPGERVRARVDTRRRDVIHATVVEVLDPDSDRREMSGTEDPACGGQVYQHICYRRQLELKSEVVRDALRRIGQFPDVRPVPVAGSPERGFRLRARLHIGPRGLGFLRAGTHETCDVGQTGQLLPETERVVAEIGQRLDRRSTVGTSLAHVDVAENVEGDERVVHFTLRRSLKYRRLAEIAELPGVSGVSVRPMRGGIVRIAGSATLGDPVAVLSGGEGPKDAELRRHAPAFFQVNRYMVPTLVAAVGQRVPPGPVLDLYAGVGLFAVSLAGRVGVAVTAVERDRLAVGDLRCNAEPFGPRLRVVGAPVERYLLQRTSPIEGTVVLDPSTRRTCARPHRALGNAERAHGRVCLLRPSHVRARSSAVPRSGVRGVGHSGVRSVSEHRAHRAACDADSLKMAARYMRGGTSHPMRFNARVSWVWK